MLVFCALDLRVLWLTLVCTLPLRNVNNPPPFPPHVYFTFATLPNGDVPLATPGAQVSVVSELKVSHSRHEMCVTMDKKWKKSAAELLELIAENLRLFRKQALTRIDYVR